jgi:hypothetical protein
MREYDTYKTCTSRNISASPVCDPSCRKGSALFQTPDRKGRYNTASMIQ